MSKPCEPPAGIARLQGGLKQNGLDPHILDANLEGLLHLLRIPPRSKDTWTQRAFRHRDSHLNALQDPSTYAHFPRYERAVRDLNRLIRMAGDRRRFLLGLANYEDRECSPTSSEDLLGAAEKWEENPFSTYFQSGLRETLEDIQPSIVGFSLNYLSQAVTTFAMIGFLRSSFPGVRIALGGGLITSWMRRPAWKDPFGGLADRVVAGPGEEELLALAGVAKKEDGMAGLPDYDGFPLQDYFSPAYILPYSASQGCYWNRCSFCPERAEGNAYHPIPDTQVLDDLSFLVKKKKPLFIHFLDNALRPSLLKKLAENPPGAPWYGFARITPHLADLDFCRALHGSGCGMLQIGLESGDQGVLDRLEKGIHLDEASQALRNLGMAGIATYVYILFGTPAESEKEARKTLDFVVRHAEWIHFLNLAIFNLPLGSREGQDLATGEFYEGDLTLYSDFEHPRGWSRARVRKFLDQEFKRHPAIRRILRRDPPIFTSNHAALFARGRGV